MAAIIARITNNTGYLVEHQHDVPRNAVWIVNPTDIENDKINHIEACTSDSDSKSRGDVLYSFQGATKISIEMELVWNNPGGNTAKCRISSPSYKIDVVVVREDNPFEIDITITKK